MCDGHQLMWVLRERVGLEQGQGGKESKGEGQERV